MAWSYHDFSSRPGNLIGLNLADLQPALIIFAHRQLSSTPATAEVISSIRSHLYKFRNGALNHIAYLIQKTSVTHQITRVVDGHRLVIKRFIKLYTPLSDIGGNKLHRSSIIEIVGHL